MTAVAERTTSDLLAAFRADPKSLSPEELKTLRAELKRAKDATYEKRKDYQRGRQADISRKGRDIAPVPEVVDPARRARCERDFLAFLRTYFAKLFWRPFSADHLTFIGECQTRVLEGGFKAIAMRRKAGKTSISECLSLWGVLYGHIRLALILGANAPKTKQIILSIKRELQGNELLSQDFPEAIYPIRCLGNIANKVGGQICNGKPTWITWTKTEIVLPTIEGSQVSGSAIMGASLTSADPRGLKIKRADGVILRPDFILPDDPQTDKSANSLYQTEERERTIMSIILGANPGEKTAGIIPVTIIREKDLAWRLTDRELHPELSGERYKALPEMPTDKKLWAKYADLYRECLRMGTGFAEATDFYLANRAAMNEGAIVAWPEFFDPDRGEVDGLQHCMNVLIKDPRFFWAEYQQAPLSEVLTEEDLKIDADAVAKKLTGRDRGIVPQSAGHLVAFIDPSNLILHYAVLAVDDAMTGGPIDYGTYPPQHRSHYARRDASPTLQDVGPKGANFEGWLYAGLEALTAQILGREWRRENGTVAKIGLCLIDANMGQATETVYLFCRQSPHAALLLPSHGRFNIGASATPMSQWTKQPEDIRIAAHWRIRSNPQKRVNKYVLYDANAAKTSVAQRLKAAMGDKGCWALFGTEPREHRLFTEHLTAEYAREVKTRERTVNEWKLYVGRDNDYWDCLVGAYVAALIQGASVLTAEPVAQLVKASDLQRGAKRFGTQVRRRA